MSTHPPFQAPSTNDPVSSITGQQKQKAILQSDFDPSIPPPVGYSIGSNSPVSSYSQSTPPFAYLPLHMQHQV
jgi:hypothetical protein